MVAVDKDYILSLRHELHEYPELEFDLPRTLSVVRRELDALPLTEKTDLPYASKIPGVMHACGHDAHTAMLLGTAKILKAMEDKLTCRVMLVFQPSEEGIRSGAEALVEDWVGFGDKSDYFAFEMKSEGKIDFDLTLDDTSLKAGKDIKVTLFDAAGKKVSLDSELVSRNDLEIGKYFVAVETGNEKKNISGYKLDMSIC